MDGSAIWVQSVAETLHVDPMVSITILLRAPDRRSMITNTLRRLGRVELIEAGDGRSSKLLAPQDAVSIIEGLDRVRPFDAVILRSFEVCREAAVRGSFGDRLWSCYVLEPERDMASPYHRADLAHIAGASRVVAVQSPQMRDLFCSIVPEAAGQMVLLPPAIPDDSHGRSDPDRIVRRLLYTGKFDPFYGIDHLVDVFLNLRREFADLRFEVFGDKFTQAPEGRAYEPRIREILSSTNGVAWRGALPREQTRRRMLQGGIGLSIWDYRHGSRLNDLVVSTKLLDYAAVGLPVVLTRTASQEELLGSDYPLFVSHPQETEGRVRDALSDPAVYAEAARRTWAAGRRFTYSRVYQALRPVLRSASPAARAALG